MNTANEMILASAGTGKTFALSGRYLRLLLDDAQPGTILATTFTRKAAGEILDRIVQRLARAAQSDKAATAIAVELERPQATRQIFSEVLSRLLMDLDAVQIETLDAFFAKLARTFSLELGLPPDWEVAEEDTMNALRDYAIRRSLNAQDAAALVYELNRGEATRDVSRRIRQLVQELYGIYRETHDAGTMQAWEVMKPLPLQTDDQLREAQRELESLLPLEEKRQTTALEVDLERLRLDPSETWLEKGLLKKVAEGTLEFYRKPIDARVVALLQRFVDHAAAIRINTLVQQTAAARRFLERFHGHFEQLKLATATLRFEDINYLANRLLSSYSPGRLAFRMDRQIDHLMLDEFQDTSIDQWQVLKPLATRACSRGPNRSFFCVGDVKQAIYGWRGGVAEIFDDVRDEFAEALDDEGSLVKSWRSSPQVIELVNTVFQNIPDAPGAQDERAAFQSWVDKFPVHETARTDRTGYVTVETTEPSDHEAGAARRIQQLVAAHPGRSIGVLARTNREIAELIYQLGELGVAASEEGGNPLTDSAAVNLVLSALRLIDHPDDSIARFHVAWSPLGSTFDLTEGNWNELSSNSPCRDRAAEWRRRLLDEGYGSVIAIWAERLLPVCTEREAYRLHQLIELACRAPKQDTTRTRTFVRYVESTQVADPTTSQVRVMTVHKSKGLEFDIVVLPFLHSDGGRRANFIPGRDTPVGPITVVGHYVPESLQAYLPHEVRRAFERYANSVIHERLCVLYVAMTRSRFATHILLPFETKSDNKSTASLVVAALGVKRSNKKDLAAGVLYELGSADWSEANEGLTPTNEEPHQEATERRGTFAGELRFAARRGNRNLSWQRPSYQSGASAFSLEEIFESRPRSDAASTGSLIHACFELVNWLDDGIPDVSALVQRLHRIAPADEHLFASVVETFQKSLRGDAVRQLLTRSEFLQRVGGDGDEVSVYNERRFVWARRDRIVSGTIDRLVVRSNEGGATAAEVVDYKTGTLGATLDGRESMLSKWQGQLQTYREAVMNMLGLPASAVTACVALPGIDQVVKIEYNDV